MPISTRARSTRLVITLALGLLCQIAGAAGEPEAAVPTVKARAYLLSDYHSGQVLAERDADQRLDPASLTKLMTVYLLFQDIRDGRLRMGERVGISERAQNMPGARMFLRAGSKVGVEELLQGMLVQSANDAALALVERAAGAEPAFVERMNAQAQALGLGNTHYANSTGLAADNHYSSARDIDTLARALFKEFPDYRGWYAQKEYTYAGVTQYNRNALLWRDNSVDGIKTGHTRSAGYCLVASARRDNMRLIATVLGSTDERNRSDGAERLLNYGFRQFETRLLYVAQRPALNIKVWMGSGGELPVGPAQDLYLTMPRGQHGQVRADINIPETPVAPVAGGQTVGTLRLRLGDTLVGEFPLVALRGVETGNALQRAWDRVHMWMQ